MMWHLYSGHCMHVIWMDEVLIFKLHSSIAAIFDVGFVNARAFWKAWKGIYKVVGSH